MPVNRQDIVAFLDKLQPADLGDNENDRTQVSAAVERLAQRFGNPALKIAEICTMQPVEMGALRTLHDLGLWEKWYELGGEKSLDDLVKMASADVDPNLLRRLCRFLAARHDIREVGEDRYEPTSFSTHLGNKKTLAVYWLRSYFDHWQHSVPNLPAFLKKTNYREPVDPIHTSYKDGNPEQMDFWSRVSSNPAYQESFGRAMESSGRKRIPWSRFYDTDSLLSGLDPGSVIVVDIGGNVGSDISHFLTKHPYVPAGSLVLQDRPEALKLAKVSDKIDTMSYDFFTPQPVKGSRAYFMHSILHDWADKEAIQILQNVVPAMRRGYSKLLLNEFVMLPTGASAVQAGVDLSVMALIGSRERTKAMWEDVLGRAGLAVTKLWPDPRGLETVIEAELAERSVL